ncbi:MAG TPA: helix-turn-helix transcriptional regulator [Candidatus Saccharimonadales bacterium]|nr:helix-turn-helix transcriptional regulator [Candidatus Saccharimonadales bacterium]
MNEANKNPYKPLGKKLKQLRTQANESLAEVSGAVEIDVMELASFELGKARPAEDVLLLLISHFGAKDDEAVKLWEIAGYGLEKIPVSRETNGLSLIQPTAGEDRVLFTDVVDIVVNNYGVIMNFMQSGPVNTSQTVARVGMSREHAKSILKILQATLTQTERNIPKTSNDNQ